MCQHGLLFSVRFQLSNNLSEWKRSSALERNREKTKEVIKWLGIHDYSNSLLLSELCNVKNKGQGAFYKSLEKEGLIKSNTAPGLPFKVYVLTQNGLDMARVLLPNHVVIKKKIPSWIYLVHSFSIQKYVLDRRNDIVDFIPEKSLPTEEMKHKPDGLLIYQDGKKEAIEIELTKKSTPRIYNIYISHLRNIKNEIYEKVTYIFNDDILRKHYENLCGQPLWPVYIMNDNKKLIKSHKAENLDVAAMQAHSSFSFGTRELYKL